MNFRRSTMFALAALCVFPMLASAAVVQKWKTPAGTNYLWLPSVSGGLAEDPTYEMVTLEIQSGGVAKVAVRSGSTGSLLAQTAGTYADPRDFLVANVNSTGSNEILFTDVATGTLNCLTYTPGSGTLAVRFSFKPTPNGVPSEWKFADLDGTFEYYMVFKDEAALSNNYYVRDNNGVLVATLTPAGAPSGNNWTRSLSVDDYDGDGRQEILIDYHNEQVPRQDVLYVYESNTPGPAQPVMNPAPLFPHVAEADGRESSLSPPRSSGLALRRGEPVRMGGSR